MPWTEANGHGRRPVYRHEGRDKKGPTFATDAEAWQWLEDNQGVVRGATVDGLVKLWEDERPTPHRIECTQRIRRAAIAEGWGRVQDLTPAKLQRFMTSAIRVRTVRNLKAVLRWGQAIHRVPVAEDLFKLSSPGASPKVRKRLLTDVQIESIRAAAAGRGPRSRAIIGYLMRYGARPITACRLRRRDLVGTTLTIENAKHSGGWSHPVTPQEAQRWRALTKGPPWNGSPDAPLFPHPQHDRAWQIRRGSASELALWYRYIATDADLPTELMGIYNLKRRAITDMLSRGIDVATVALFTGHKTLDQVLTYTLTNNEKAAAALKLITEPPKPHPNHLKRIAKSKNKI